MDKISELSQGTKSLLYLALLGGGGAAAGSQLTSDPLKGALTGGAVGTLSHGALFIKPRLMHSDVLKTLTTPEKAIQKATDLAFAGTIGSGAGLGLYEAIRRGKGAMDKKTKDSPKTASEKTMLQQVLEKNSGWMDTAGDLLGMAGSYLKSTAPAAVDMEKIKLGQPYADKLFSELKTRGVGDKNFNMETLKPILGSDSFQKSMKANVGAGALGEGKIWDSSKNIDLMRYNLENNPLYASKMTPELKAQMGIYFDRANPLSTSNIASFAIPGFFGLALLKKFLGRAKAMRSRSIGQNQFANSPYAQSYMQFDPSVWRQ